MLQLLDPVLVVLLNACMSIEGVIPPPPSFTKEKKTLSWPEKFSTSSFSLILREREGGGEEEGGKEGEGIESKAER